MPSIITPSRHPWLPSLPILTAVGYCHCVKMPSSLKRGWFIDSKILTIRDIKGRRAILIWNKLRRIKGNAYYIYISNGIVVIRRRRCYSNAHVVQHIFETSTSVSCVSPRFMHSSSFHTLLIGWCLLLHLAWGMLHGLAIINGGGWWLVLFVMVRAV